jgi:hypothetical protein
MRGWKCSLETQAWRSLGNGTHVLAIAFPPKCKQERKKGSKTLRAQIVCEGTHKNTRLCTHGQTKTRGESSHLKHELEKPLAMVFLPQSPHSHPCK